MASVEIQSLSLSASQDSPYWQLRMKLSNADDYGIFVRGYEFTVNLAGTNYAMVTDSRSMQRSVSTAGQPTRTATITALSPLAKQANPRSLGVTKTYDAAMTASAIIADLIGAITWNTTDWAIPAFAFGVSNQSPLSAAQQITNAVGATIQSNADGSVKIQPRHKVSVPSYDTATPDIELTQDDIYSIQETISTDQWFNSVTIRENSNDSDTQDRIEFTADENNGLTGIARVYPDPYRTSVLLNSTRNGVALTPLGEVTRSEIEQITVEDGRGSTQFPISAITGLEWRDVNLGGVTFDGNEVTTTTAGYTLLNITYNVKSLDYTATADQAKDALLILEDV